MTYCESSSCCEHPDEAERVLNRDGVLTVVCTECQQELGPAPELLQSPELTITVNAPCGDDIPHPWGYL